MGDAAALSAAINKAVDIAATLVVDEISRRYRLQEDIRWLEQQMRLMQAYIQFVEEKKFTNSMVATFTKGIRDLAHDIEDIFDIFLSQIHEHKSSALFKRVKRTVPYSVMCSMFSREIEKIRNRVQGIKEDKENYSIPDINLPEEAEAPNVDPRTTRLDVDDYLVVGFDEHIEKVKTKLENHQFVTIVGMPGLGKTTLAKKVFNGVKGDFQCAASVSVSQDPNINSLWQDIAKQVGLDEKKRNENLEVNLKSLLQEKRYILLLDDIWSTAVWDRLVECFPVNSGQSASRIIITSRKNDVGRYIGCEDSLHFLHPFDESTSWELFSKSIIPFFNTAEEFEHSELKKIGEKIVEKCGGVPLGIVVVVGLLRQREKSEFCWNDVLNNIGHDKSDKCFQIFSLSYIDLPTALKSCFVYFGSFPEDYEYSAFKLIRMWVAEKLVVGISGRDLEDVGKSYMSDLDSRNLIQVVKREVDGRVKKFRVHDLLHNICEEKGREFDFLNSIRHLDPAYVSKVRRLGVFGDDVLKYGMPKIRGLFHFKLDERNQQKHLKTTLGKSKLLRVLTFQTTLDRFPLPASVGSLSCLNYLQIKSTRNNVEIPLSIQNLKNLETLIVDDAWVITIPIGIWKMEQLKHLHLSVHRIRYHIRDYCVQLLRGLHVQVSLPNIQTLHLPRSFPKNIRMLPKLTTLRKLTLIKVTPEMMEVLCGREPISNNLEALKCWNWEGRSGMRMNLSKYGMLANLEIGLYSASDFHDQDLPPSLIKITLLDCFLMSNSTLEILKKLPKLKILELIRMDFGSKMDCSGGFLQLEVLKLFELYDLEELIEGEGEEMGMPKLKQLIIQNRSKLVRIPERLQQLRAPKS